MRYRHLMVGLVVAAQAFAALAQSTGQQGRTNRLGSAFEQAGASVNASDSTHERAGPKDPAGSTTTEGSHGARATQGGATDQAGTPQQPGGSGR